MPLEFRSAVNGSKTSAGTVSSLSSGTLTLKPNNSGTTFTAEVSGNGITAINGTITWSDSTTSSAPGTVTPPGGDLDDSYANTIAVLGGSVYIAGEYSDRSKNIAFYWKDEVKTDLPGANGIANAIAVSGDSVYVAGYYRDANYNYIACYWKNGVKTDLF